MALNLSTVEFLKRKIQSSEYIDFNFVIGQLFSYLKQELVDNPIYDYYLRRERDWENIDYEERLYTGNTLPKDFSEAKSLVFFLYHRLSTLDRNHSISFIQDIVGGDNANSSSNKFLNLTFGYLDKALDDIANANPEFESPSPRIAAGNLAFIIHGHDDQLKAEAQLLLLRAGINTVVLHEQPDAGRTIIDKLIGESEKADYAIALLSPDDLVNTGIHRARQNVILEIGYFMGKLGKERVRLIMRDNVEIPSDLQGVLYEKYDSSGQWKVKLMKEMMHAGFYVDMNAVIKVL
jgi:predicted nucleotide-binding protein